MVVSSSHRRMMHELRREVATWNHFVRLVMWEASQMVEERPAASFPVALLSITCDATASADATATINHTAAAAHA